jgi:hypothetical protein
MRREYSKPDRDRRLAKVLKTLEGDEPLVLVIRSHIWLEHRLNAILESAVAVPSALRVDKLNFDRKVQLCEAFGLIWPGLARALRSVNRLRKLTTSSWFSLRNWRESIALTPPMNSAPLGRSFGRSESN